MYFLVQVPSSILSARRLRSWKGVWKVVSVAKKRKKGETYKKFRPFLRIMSFFFCKWSYFINFNVPFLPVSLFMRST